MEKNYSLKQIVITGSTRGIGYGLADAFLERGCSVTISGRNQETVDKAVTSLSKKHDPASILGQICDMCQPQQVKTLWDAVVSSFGKIDVWINNAGQSGPQQLVWKVAAQQAKEVIETNVLGVIYGSKTALEGMLKQGHGSLYNMEGMGSDGRKHNGLTLYGTSKYALTYFTDCLVNETKGTPLIIGAIRPGMVATELIKGQFADKPEEWERTKHIFNMLAERVEVVTPWLADRILANQKTGQRIIYMSTGRMMKRMLSMPFKKRNIFN